MTDHIKAAQEAGFAGWKCDEAKIQRLYAIAYRQGLEKAAEICESRAQMLMHPSTSNHAVLSAAGAIRAHAQNVDMTPPSCTKSEGN